MTRTRTATGLCLCLLIGTGCAASTSASTVQSARERQLFAEVARLKQEIALLEARSVQRENLANVVALAAKQPESEATMESGAVKATRPEVAGLSPVASTNELPCPPTSKELRELSRALSRVVDRLDLTAEEKREVLQSVRPVRTLDSENPWVAAK